ncbi:MAG: hypothetical protein FWG41_00590 [Methanomassiliicoccaceae archaeon]|nr:hypothetical protein [Methanomassiliicoccaceae archaeon]
MIELLACSLGRNDEAPNIELAERLCSSMDKEGVREIAEGLGSKDRAVADDCIKVLYEVGQREPELIADHTEDLIASLSSKNNRIVWGCMTALAYVTPVRPETVFGRLPEIVAAYRKGSVITIDNSISVFAHLCNADDDYRATVFPILLDHLANCRAKEIPQHAERIAVCIDPKSKEAFVKALDAREGELSEAGKSRIAKLKKRL